MTRLTPGPVPGPSPARTPAPAPSPTAPATPGPELAVIRPPGEAAQHHELASPVRTRLSSQLQFGRSEFSDGDRPLRLRIGDKTVAVGTLASQYSRDPQRVEDYLRGHGISLETLSAVLFEAMSHPENRGRVIDLSPASTTARAYGIDQTGDALVTDHHLRDASALVGEASRGPSLVDGLTASGDGFIRNDFLSLLLAIVDVFLEAVTFGQLDTVTFNGAGAPEHFKARGAELARENPAAWQLMLATPDGEATLRARLRDRAPDGVNAGQWRRAVDDMVSGARAHFATLPPEARLGEGLDRAQLETLQRHLHTTGYSPEAALGVLGLSRAAPAELRDQAITLLGQLPQAERNNLVSLFGAPSAEPPAVDDGPAQRLQRFRETFTDAAPDARLALFETMRRAGFRVAPGAPELEALREAISNAPHWPELRAPFLSLLPALGVSRASLATLPEIGINARLIRFAQRGDMDGGLALLRELGENSNSTSNMRLILARSQGFVRAHDLTLTSLDSSQQRLVRTTFTTRNIGVAVDARVGDAWVRKTVVPNGEGSDSEISLERYFRDASYRDAVLLSMLPTVNPNPRQRTADIADFRAQFERMLFSVAKSAPETNTASYLRDASRTSAREGSNAFDEVELAPRAAHIGEMEAADDRVRALELTERGTASVIVDATRGSQLYHLFDLQSERPRDPVVRMAQSTFSEAIGEFSLRLPRVGEVTLSEMQEIMAAPNPREAFAQSRLAGKLDFRDTVLAFAYYVAQPDMPLDDPPPVIDLTVPSRNAIENELRARIADGRDGNLSGRLSRFLTATFDGDPRIARDDVEAVVTGSDIIAASPVDRFQYSHMGRGFAAADETVLIRDQARLLRESPPTDWQLQPGERSPMHVLGAIMMLDHRTVNARGEREDGDAFGNLAGFIGLPSSRVHVVSVTGSDGKAGPRASFRRDSDMLMQSFDTDGGVPRANMQQIIAPRRDDLEALLEARILETPPGDAFVFHFSGHGSEGGMALPGGSLGGASLRRLIELAEGRGVKFVMLSSACRSGERVAEAREVYMERLRDAGLLPPVVNTLDTLRSHLVEHATYTKHAVSEAANRPPAMPTLDAVRSLVRRAMGSGPDAETARAELADLQQNASLEQQRLSEAADEATGSRERTLRAQASYTDNIVALARSGLGIIAARDELAAHEPRSERMREILEHPLLRAANPESIGTSKGELVRGLGPLMDLMTTEMNRLIPPLDLSTPSVESALRTAA